MRHLACAALIGAPGDFEGELMNNQGPGGHPVLRVGILALCALPMLAWSAAGGEAGTLVQDVARTLNEGEVGEMSFTRALSWFLLLIAPLLLLVWSYNKLVDEEERTLAAWSQVESNYQRRADLVPRLVEAVSRYLQHEGETLAVVGAQRNQLEAVLAELVDQQGRAAQARQSLAGGAPREQPALEAFSDEEGVLGGALRRVIATAEAYPELRSSDQFLALQAQLEGTENRINVARMDFNDAVALYNASMRRLPHSLVAGLGGFQRKAYFRSVAGAEQAGGLGLVK